MVEERKYESGFLISTKQKYQLLGQYISGIISESDSSYWSRRKYRRCYFLDYKYDNNCRFQVE